MGMNSSSGPETTNSLIAGNHVNAVTGSNIVAHSDNNENTVQSSVENVTTKTNEYTNPTPLSASSSPFVNIDTTTASSTSTSTNISTSAVKSSQCSNPCIELTEPINERLPKNSRLPKTKSMFEANFRLESTSSYLSPIQSYTQMNPSDDLQHKEGSSGSDHNSFSAMGHRLKRALSFEKVNEHRVSRSHNNSHDNSDNDESLKNNNNTDAGKFTIRKSRSFGGRINEPEFVPQSTGEPCLCKSCRRESDHHVGIKNFLSETRLRKSITPKSKDEREKEKEEKQRQKEKEKEEEKRKSTLPKRIRIVSFPGTSVDSDIASPISPRLSSMTDIKLGSSSADEEDYSGPNHNLFTRVTDIIMNPLMSNNVYRRNEPKSLKQSNQIISQQQEDRAQGKSETPPPCFVVFVAHLVSNSNDYLWKYKTRKKDQAIFQVNATNISVEPLMSREKGKGTIEVYPYSKIKSFSIGDVQTAERDMKLLVIEVANDLILAFATYQVDEIIDVLRVYVSRARYLT